MWSMHKILVPTDFSESSAAALREAVELAKKFDATIVLMHTYQIPAFPYAKAPRASLADLAAEIQTSARETLEATAARAHENSGVSITTALYAGIPWEQIFNAAKEHAVSHIVMGTRGLYPIPGSLVGSTAERVVRCARVPVMTLHGPSTVPAEI